jgi:hypothetical protein
MGGCDRGGLNIGSLLSSPSRRTTISTPSTCRRPSAEIGDHSGTTQSGHHRQHESFGGRGLPDLECQTIVIASPDRAHGVANGHSSPQCSQPDRSRRNRNAEGWLVVAPAMHLDRAGPRRGQASAVVPATLSRAQFAVRPGESRRRLCVLARLREFPRPWPRLAAKSKGEGWWRCGHSPGSCPRGAPTP